MKSETHHGQMLIAVATKEWKIGIGITDFLKSINFLMGLSFLSGEFERVLDQRPFFY